MGSCRNGKLKSGKGAESMETHKGLIIHLVKNKGYGFIKEDETGETVFFHATGVCEPKEFSDLREGLPVEYMVRETPKGIKAIGVVAI
jgi:cold shock CspA family protein